jgi:hypothetical protein
MTAKRSNLIHTTLICLVKITLFQHLWWVLKIKEFLILSWLSGRHETPSFTFSELQEGGVLLHCGG